MGKNFDIFFKNLVPKLFCFKFIYTVVFLWESVGKTQAHPDMRQNTRSNIIHVNGIPCSYQCDKSISGEECDNMKKIYKFGLCSTGINEHTAQIMQEYADVVWSCASKNVLEYIEPNAIL